MATNMGLGALGSDAIIFKRKFRWGLSIATCNSTKLIPEYLVKLASRPNLTIEETEINRMNAKTWIPGKASWETITVTYYDVTDSNLINLYSWLASVYNFANTSGITGSDNGTLTNNLTMASKKREYAGVATLKLYDGCGNTMETWLLKDVWPQAVNFGDLDYSSSEEVTIELTLRYSDVVYTNNCGSGKIDPCACTPC